MEGMKEIFFRSELHVLLSCYISQYSNSTFPLEHTTAGEKKKPVPERREEFGKIKVAPACFLLVSCGLLAGLKQPCFTGGFEIRGDSAVRKSYAPGWWAQILNQRSISSFSRVRVAWEPGPPGPDGHSLRSAETVMQARAYAMLRKGFQPREAGIFRSREPEPQLRRSSPSRRSRSCLRHFFVLYPPGFFEMKRKLIYVKNGLCRCRSIGKRNFPKMFFFQMCRLDPGFQIRNVFMKPF